MKGIAKKNPLIDCTDDYFAKIDQIDTTCAYREFSINTQILIIFFDKGVGQGLKRNVAKFELLLDEIF